MHAMIFAAGFLAGFDTLLVLGLCGFMLWARRGDAGVDGRGHPLGVSRD